MNQIDALQNNLSGEKMVAMQPPAAGKPSEVTAEKKVSDDCIDRVSVNEAVQNINAALNALRKDESQFSVDEDLGRLVVKIINSDTKELIRQIPTEDALALSKKMQDMIGLLFD